MVDPGLSWLCLQGWVDGLRVGIFVVKCYRFCLKKEEYGIKYRLEACQIQFQEGTDRTFGISHFR